MKNYLPPHAQPDFPGLLTDSQEQALATVQKGLQHVTKALQRINGIILDNKLRMRPVAAYPSVGMAYSEVDRLAFEHDLAYSKLRQSCNAPEGMAA